MKKILIGIVPVIIMLTLTTVGNSGHDKVSKSGCTYKGIKLCGNVQIVNSFPDIKVRVVTSFPDLKVQTVNSFPDKCGKWQFVTSFPDFKIQYVDSFPDLKIMFVNSFPGID